jgi:hypothetical protein
VFAADLAARELPEPAQQASPHAATRDSDRIAA